MEIPCQPQMQAKYNLKYPSSRIKKIKKDKLFLVIYFI